MKGTDLFECEAEACMSHTTCTTAACSCSNKLAACDISLDVISCCRCFALANALEVHLCYNIARHLASRAVCTFTISIQLVPSSPTTPRAMV